MNAFDEFIDRLHEVTEGVRFRRGTEKQLQDDLDGIFTLRGLIYAREHSFDKEDRVDFFFWNGVALEVKIKGSVEAHLRQLKRYAEHSMVTGVILVAMRPYDVPATLNGKPVRCLNFAPKCL